MEDTVNHIDNTSKPWLWKKGQSGNLAGRPKGITMKEYAKQYLSKLTEDERDEWLDGIEKKEVWKMAEGLPKADVELSGEITEKIISVDE